MKYIFVIFLFLSVKILFSQDNTYLPETDTLSKNRMIPHEIKIGMNARRLIQTLVSQPVTSYEFQAALALHKYFLFVDYGMQKTQRGLDHPYVSAGNYYRIGASKNFIENIASGNVLALGLRYAFARFSDKINFNTSDSFGSQPISVENPNLKSRWFEIVADIRGRVISNVYMGFSLRWQIEQKLSNANRLQTFEIPGFGNTKRNNSTAFDYYILWKIPFNKAGRKDI